MVVTPERRENGEREKMKIREKKERENRRLLARSPLFLQSNPLSSHPQKFFTSTRNSFVCLRDAVSIDFLLCISLKRLCEANVVSYCRDKGKKKREEKAVFAKRMATRK
ncbi:hypothetical protein CEXT_625921 [Caerostris extrusa]|uniref:Uncharacterized protein n=1 Tax=Caerostris extrusa TaxID=172846 RepID=A0AAV4WTT5_CAEEX|nr:hypothetical protein CEXT_625921 [Caerostris extrusa]